MYPYTPEGYRVRDTTPYGTPPGYRGTRLFFVSFQRLLVCSLFVRGEKRIRKGKKTGDLYGEKKGFVRERILVCSLFVRGTAPNLLLDTTTRKRGTRQDPIKLSHLIETFLPDKKTHVSLSPFPDFFKREKNLYNEMKGYYPLQVSCL